MVSGSAVVAAASIVMAHFCRKLGSYDIHNHE
jgi:hypothetical protein